MALRLSGSTSGFTALDAPAAAGSNTLVLPTGNGTARQTMMTDGAGALSFSWDAGSLFYRLDSNLAGANVNTAQSVFGVGVTLAGSTVYGFDAVYAFTKSAGATSHGFQLNFGGTASINNVGYLTSVAYSPTSLTTAPTTSTSGNFVQMFPQVITAVTVITPIASATSNLTISLKGTVSINAGGTFIPQYTLSAAPGGAYSTVAGSYIKFTPIGAAGSASSQGTWS